MKIRKIFVVLLLIIYLIIASVSIFGGVLNTGNGDIFVLKTTPTFEKYWLSDGENSIHFFNSPGEWYFNNDYIVVSHSATVVWLFFWIFELWRLFTVVMLIAFIVYWFIRIYKILINLFKKF